MSSWQAVAVDYDGTLTTGASPDPEVLEAVRAARAAGLAVVLVTGRILAELRRAFPDVDDEFDAIVAENGAVLAGPDGTRDLAQPVDPALRDALDRHDVPVRRGRVLLACDGADATAVLAHISRLGLDDQVVRNRAAVMVLPAGVTKGSGVAEALGDLRISRHSAIGVGDAENDHALLAACEVGVAVGDAVPALKRHADLVLDAGDGAGVVELLRGPVLGGRTRLVPRRWQLELGSGADGAPVRIPASQINLLIVGASGSGKSYLTGLLAEQLSQLGYGLLLIDREGDHVALADRRGVVVVGGPDGLPSTHHLTDLLRHRCSTVVLDLSLLDDQAQHGYLRQVLPAVHAQRGATGLPHWIFLDEAHAMLEPVGWAASMGTGGARGYCYTTFCPDSLPRWVCDDVDHLLAVAGGKPEGQATSVRFASELSGHDQDTIADLLGDDWGHALLLDPRAPGPPVAFRAGARASRHVRHWHKYLDASLSPRLGFHFHATGHVAGNVRDFHRHLGACPAETITHHSARHDFSRWVRDVLQDQQLAATIDEIEAGHDGELDVQPTRRALRTAIETRYFD